MTEYIKREDAIEAMYKVSDDNLWIPFHNEQLIALEGLTAEDVQPVVHGRWIQTGGKYSRHKTIDRRILTCSVCGNALSMEGVNAGHGDANYCPNCGADMRGE